MRLKKGFVTHETDGEQVLIATGDAHFAGIVRSNRTAAYILDLLKEEITKEQIIENMYNKYDAPSSVCLQQQC